MVRLIIRNIITFFACLVLAAATGANDVVYERVENNSFVFAYKSPNHTDNSINNFFIKEIAKYNFSSLYNTSFTFHYSIHKSIQQTAPNTFTVSAILVGEKCTGDIYYKNFDISDILLPEKADFKVVVIDSGNFVEIRNFENISLNDNKFLSEFTFESLNEDKTFSLKLEDIHFYSDNDDKETFFARINHIDNYYASISAMDYALEEFSMIKLESSTIIETFLKLQDLERIYLIAQNNKFSHVLDLENNDNSGFYDKLFKLENQVARFSAHFDILLNSYDYLEIKESMPECAVFYVNEIANYLSLSQEVTHSQSSYFYQLGKINYVISTINSYEKGLRKILANTGYCYDIHQILDSFKDEVFKAFLSKSSEFISTEQFYLAKGLLLNAQSFHKTTNKSSIPLELSILISKANYGIYDSYLHLIDRAIDVGNYELAENYIVKAQSFQKENSASIITDEYIKKISSKLATLYISKGYRSIEEDEFDDAIYCFNQAQNICHKIGQFNFDYEIKHGLIEARIGLYLSLITIANENLLSGKIAIAKLYMDRASNLAKKYDSRMLTMQRYDSIFSTINFYTYQNLISKGKNYLTSGNYSQAYQYFLEAFYLEEDYNFELSDELPYLFAEAAAPVLVDLCSLGEVKVKKSELDEARVIYNRCLNLQVEYGLLFETQLQESLVLLNNSIFNKHCDFANHEFDNAIDYFNNTVNQGDFISAIAILDQTDDMVYKNYYCEFDKDLVVELRNMYSPAADYQKLARIAQDALSTKDHQKFIEVHKQMEELSSKYEVIRQRIEPLPLHYLFSAKKNLAMLESSVEYFKSEEEFEIAFKLLGMLESNNFSDKETKTIQQKLANQMALADKQNPNINDPKITAEKYTEGKTYYKHFRKAYKKSW